MLTTFIEHITSDEYYDNTRQTFVKHSSNIRQTLVKHSSNTRTILAENIGAHVRVVVIDASHLTAEVGRLVVQQKKLIGSHR